MVVLLLVTQALSSVYTYHLVEYNNKKRFSPSKYRHGPAHPQAVILKK
jgi:hypothetical protein